MPVMARICNWKVVATGKIFSEKKSTCDYLCDFSSCEVCHFKVWWFYDLLNAVRAIKRDKTREYGEFPRNNMFQSVLQHWLETLYSHISSRLFHLTIF